MDDLARALSGMSAGRQPYVGDRLSGARLLLVVGAEDAKFIRIAEELAGRSRAQVVKLPDCGHAAHIERAELIAPAIRSFFGHV